MCNLLKIMIKFFFFLYLKAIYVQHVCILSDYTSKGYQLSFIAPIKKDKLPGDHDRQIEKLMDRRRLKNIFTKPSRKLCNFSFTFWSKGEFFEEKSKK